ncbi:MAG: T9SS type A sorting domain-containing protein [Bacteroidales bacterium]|nr:T9SS type A sorting domain-containing protein [Bacteroidales bacterium]
MKLLNYLSFVTALFFLVSNVAKAQDTITVTPGFGTLEAAIAENGGDVVYELQAGEWYGSQSVIEVNETTLKGAGKSLVIIGEETDGMPAIIQVGNAADGSVFPQIFNVFSDMTLKNLFLAAQDFDGVMGAGMMTVNAPVSVTIDNCVIDPVGVNYMIGGVVAANGSSFYFTNNLVLRNGHVLGPNDGGYWFSNVKYDTLWVENNTFVSSGQDFIGGGFHTSPQNQFIWVNHNTFLWHDVWIKKTYNDKDFYFTNNLMHDISIFAQLYAWGQFFPDYTPDGNRMLSLTAIDTAYTVDGEGVITLETLPSDRRMFWQYNLQYNSDQLKQLPKWAADNGKAPLYLIPMLWNDDTPQDYASFPVVSPADSSREAKILADKTNWPYMKFNNNWYDKNPGYEDQVIDQMNDSMFANVINWYKNNIFSEPTDLNQADAPSYMWDVDKWAGTPTAEYPSVWPRFNGKYTNPELLTASIEGLPLGDLNWFPEAKARWESEKAQIQEHILALNESKYVITTGVEKISLAKNISIYPNPANEILQITSEKSLKNISIFNVAGQKVMDVDMNNMVQRNIDISGLNKGLYLVKVRDNEGAVYSTKVVKQ